MATDISRLGLGALIVRTWRIRHSGELLRAMR